jgi:type I restriction enzyme M protein
MAIVLPHNKFATDSFAYMREWLLGKARVLAVVGLGRHTFLPHTHQKASVLFLQKIEGKEMKKDYPIFFSISERDGKNSKGQFIHRNPTAECLWERVDHDFTEIENGFMAFCKEQGV